MDAISRAVKALQALVLTTVLVAMIWERRQPAYPTDYRRTWKRDVAVQRRLALGL
jgi:hypothetical protein